MGTGRKALPGTNASLIFLQIPVTKKSKFYKTDTRLIESTAPYSPNLSERSSSPTSFERWPTHRVVLQTGEKIRIVSKLLIDLL